jgi:hypothetical protein
MMLSHIRARLHACGRLGRLFLLAVAVLLTAGDSVADPVAVAARPQPLQAIGSDERQTVGALRFRGALELKSADKRFGGFSGLLVSPDGSRLTAISDEGYWFTGRLRYAADGALAGLDQTQLEKMRGLSGQPLPNKWWSDAEALALLPDGGLAVAFEGRKRLWRYPGVGGRPQSLPSPPGLADAPPNGAIEALTALKNGRLLALTEELAVEGGLRGWIGNRPLVYPMSEGYRPTGAATLPNGDVLVLERRIFPPSARVQRLAAAQLDAAVLKPVELARLNGGLTLDNMEGIDARRDRDGRIAVYLISDDNRSRWQRTLLMMFEIDPAALTLSQR